MWSVRHCSRTHWEHPVHRSLIWSHMRADAALSVGTYDVKTPLKVLKKWGGGWFFVGSRRFSLFLIFGRRADHPMIFYFFHFFYHRILVSNCSKFRVKKWDPLYSYVCAPSHPGSTAKSGFSVQLVIGALIDHTIGCGIWSRVMDFQATIMISCWFWGKRAGSPNLDCHSGHKLLFWLLILAGSTLPVRLSIIESLSLSLSLSSFSFFFVRVCVRKSNKMGKPKRTLGNTDNAKRHPGLKKYFCYCSFICWSPDNPLECINEKNKHRVKQKEKETIKYTYFVTTKGTHLEQVHERSQKSMLRCPGTLFTSHETPLFLF